MANSLVPYSLVAQVAGDIQGLPDGDLGELGKASFTDSQTSHFLTLVMDEVAKSITEADSSKTSSSSSGQSGPRSGHVIDALSKVQRTLLELVARLLAHAQRQYIGGEEWGLVDDHEQFFIQQVGEVGSHGEWEMPCPPVQKRCSVEQLAASPWSIHILRKLHQWAVSGGAAMDTPLVDQSQENTLLGSGDIPATTYPLFKHFSTAMEEEESSSATILSVLPIVAVCAEVFPSGRCYVSQCQKGWTRLKPTDRMREKNMYSLGCSGFDLGMIIHLLARLLVVTGSSGQDMVAQRWLLVTLARLTETSAIVSLNDPDDQDGIAAMAEGWRSVYGVLFRHDLRYLSYTEKAGRDTLGDLVLVLLTNMIRRRCTDPVQLQSESGRSNTQSFLYMNQSKVWGLPVFARPEAIKTTAPFELISATLHCSGLSESGIDQLSSPLGPSLFSDPSDSMLGADATNRSMGRRGHLISFVVSVLDKTLREGKGGSPVTFETDRFVTALSGCLVALIDGCGDPLEACPGTCDLSFGRTSDCPSVFQLGLSSSVKLVATGYQQQSHLRYFQQLWVTGDGLERKSAADNAPSAAQDKVYLQSSRLRNNLSAIQAEVHKCHDFVSQVDSVQMRRAVSRYFAKRLSFAFKSDASNTSLHSNESDGYNSSDSSGEIRTVPNSWKSLSAKLLMTTGISHRFDVSVQFIKEFTTDINLFLCQLPSILLELCEHRDEFLVFSTHVEQMLKMIAGMSSDSVRLGINYSTFEALAKCAQSLIRSYSKRSRYAEIRGSRSSKNSSWSKPQAEIDLFDEDDDDFVDSSNARNNGSNSNPRRNLDDDDSDASVGGKRKRTTMSDAGGNVSRKRRLHESDRGQTSPSDFICAGKICSILILLNPSPENCKLIVESLLGIEIDLDPDSIEGDMDLRAAPLCAAMLCDVGFIFNSPASTKYDGGEIDTNPPTNGVSPIIALCQMIELVRVCATPELPFHSFGYLSCSESVRVADCPIREMPMTKVQASAIISILKDEASNHDINPLVRSERVRGASASFRSAGRLFHDLFDREFVGNFLKTSIVDTSARVREESRVCVAMAMSSLNEIKTADFVIKHGAPITYSTNPDEVVESFCSWFSTLELLPSSDVSDDNLHAMDAMDAMEHDSILNRVTLASTATSEDVFRRLLCDLICIAAERPDLESSCFRGLEEIALQRNYQSVENMIEEESCAIICHWVEEDRSFESMPLLVVAPSTVRQIQRAGQSNFLVGNRTKADEFFSLSKVLSHASWAFLTRFSRFSVPLTVVRTVSKLEVSERCAKSMIEQARTRNLCAILMHKEDQEASIEAKEIIVILKQHAADILGFCIAMEYSDDADQEVLGKTVRKVLEAALTEKKFERRIESQKSVVVRRILELSGMSGQCRGFLPTKREAFFNGLHGFVTEIDPSAADRGDVLLSVGSSLTEYLIEALLWLDGAPRENMQLQRWNVVKILVQLMLTQVKSGMFKLVQIGRVIHTVTEVVLRGSVYSVRVRAVEALLGILKVVRDHIQDGTGNEVLRQEVLDALPRIVGVCYYVHETGQKELLNHCHSQYGRSFSMFNSGLGILGISRVQADDDVWGWDSGVDGLSTDSWKSKRAVAEVGPRVGNDFLDILTSTFDVLEWISEHEKILSIDSLSFSGAASPNDRTWSKSGITATEFESLQDLNPRLCGQALTERFVCDLSPTQDSVEKLNEMLSVFHDRLANGTSWASGKERIDGPSPLSMEHRLIYSDLRQIERSLRFLRKAKGQTLLKILSKEDLKRLVNDLALVCGTRWPLQLRDISSRCLGEIDILSIELLCKGGRIQTRQAKDSRSVEHIQPRTVVSKLQSDCICILAGLLGSPKPDIALLAAKTLGGMLAAESSSKDCLEHIRDPKIRTSIEPFIQQATLDTSNNLFLSTSEIAKLMGPINNAGDGDTSWCWDERLWTFDPKSSTFDDWIRVLTPAIILCCCCEQPDSDSNPPQIGPKYAGFFSLCPKMCMRDPDFAATCFKCLIITLLVGQSSQSNGKRSSSRTFEVKNPQVKDNLSKCFTTLLQAHSHEISQDGSISAALGLSVEILSLLRRITQQVFMDSHGHRKNPTLAPSKARDRPQVTWEGVPFGVVMNIDGLLLAKACVQTRQFTEALFFIELHLNSQLGVSGGVLELVSKDQLGSMSALCHKTSLDISGSNPVIPDNCNLKGEDIKDHALQAIRLMKICFEEMHNVQDLSAIQIEESSLDFVDESFMETEIANTGSLSYIQRLDTALNFHKKTEEVQGKIVNFLSASGMNHTLKAFIDGATMNGALGELSNDSNATKAWREKWFESNLYQRNWDLCSIEEGHSRAVRRSTPAVQDSNHPKNLSSTISPGFFESLCLSFESWSSEDVKSCRSFLEQARRELLKDVASSVEGGSGLHHMVSVVDRLRGLGDLESLILRDESLAELAETWGLTTDAEYETSGAHSALHGAVVPSGQGNSVSLSFVSRIREVILRVSMEKETSVNKSYIKDYLSKHLWAVCSVANKYGLAHESEGILRRITSLLHPRGGSSLEDEANQFLSIMKVRLEEAKTMESRKDFSAAIRRSKQVVDTLSAKQMEHNANFDSKLEVLLADALIACGSWMGDYKFEQAKVVLSDYLEPGASYARSMHKQNSSIENASRSTSAHLAIAQLAAGLYDGLAARLSSPEWSKMLHRMAENGQEIIPLQAEVDKLCKSLSPKPKKETPTWRKNYQRYKEKAVTLDTLKKQTEAMQAEKDKIQSSVGTYLNLAVKSFGEALAAAGSEHSSDLTRHVCRLISLWFNGSDDFRTEENVNNLMVEIAKTVPTFRFVRFTAQLVSRIETASSQRDEGFQHALHHLVSKITLDHPYHCIPHLVALSNGKNIGSGVSGRHSESYLENVDNSKISAVNTIIGQLERVSPEYVGQLLSSYRSLTDAYISLADVPSDAITALKKDNVKHQEVVKDRSKRLVSCLEGFESCNPCVLTSPPLLRPGCDYGGGEADPIGGERVVGFEQTFSQTDTGLHRPKIVVCHGSKGGRFRQLVKGEDEIRQDAVMSQVFSFVNDLMGRSGSKAGINAGASQQIITYNIVPLSPTHGVSWNGTRIAVTPVFALSKLKCSFYVHPSCTFLKNSGSRVG